MLATAKITSKGQLTLPRVARNALGSTTVEIEVKGDTIVLKPVKSVAGALARYAAPGVSLQEIRETVWEEVARDKARRASS